MPTHIGRYRITGELGRGAVGIVYRALDETLDREVALKVLSATHARDEESRGRFLREGRSAGRLQHPNIVTIFELGEHEGAPFMAMELLDGRDLQQAIRDGLRPDPRVTLPIVLQLLAGLGHAHEHGIVHRDIKPSNVFLPHRLPVKITDFGIARLLSHSGTAMTGTGIVVGTPNYMSPEQVKAARVDARSDLFSAGLILYELVTGEKAYQADSIVSVLFKIVQGPPNLGLIPRAPEWSRLLSVLERALRAAPDDRYPDAAAMAGELTQALRDLGGATIASAPAAQRTVVQPPRSPPRPPTPDSWNRGPRELGDGTAAPAPSMLPRPAAESRWRPWHTAAMLGSVLLLTAAGYFAWRSTSPAPTIRSSPPPSPLAQAPAGNVRVGPGARTAARATLTQSPPAIPPSPRIRSAEPARLEQAPPSTARAARVEPPEPAIPLDERVARGELLFEQGRFARALAEGRAVLERDPAHRDARALVEDAEAAIAVENAIQKARAAMRKGDNETALVHVRTGLAVIPTDSRLIALFRELTQ